MGAAMVKAEAGALKRKVKVVVSKGLTALANKNATDEELAQAVGQLRRKAAQDEEKLQKRHQRLTDAYYKRKAEIIAAGRVLSADQKAKMKLEVEDEVSKQAPIVCKRIEPAAAPAV